MREKEKNILVTENPFSKSLFETSLSQLNPFRVLECKFKYMKVRELLYCILILILSLIGQILIKKRHQFEAHYSVSDLVALHPFKYPTFL